VSASRKQQLRRSRAKGRRICLRASEAVGCLGKEIALEGKLARVAGPVESALVLAVRLCSASQPDAALLLDAIPTIG
jgi:hypothetical protein